MKREREAFKYQAQAQATATALMEGAAPDQPQQDSSTFGGQRAHYETAPSSRSGSQALMVYCKELDPCRIRLRAPRQSSLSPRLFPPPLDMPQPLISHLFPREAAEDVFKANPSSSQQDRLIFQFLSRRGDLDQFRWWISNIRLGVVPWGGVLNFRR